MARLSRVEFDLAAQRGHEDAQVMRLMDNLRPPDFFEQEAMREDFARMMRERRQQLVLQRREMNFFAAREDSASGQVDRQIAVLEGAGFRLVGSAVGVTQRDSNAGQQFARAERLREIVVGTGIEPDVLPQLLQCVLS